MSDMLLILKKCFLNLAKQGEKLDNKNKLSDFLSLWLDLDKFVNEIFNCLK